MPSVFVDRIFDSDVFAVEPYVVAASFIGPYLLTSGSDTTDATSYTTASVAPTAGYVTWLVVAVRISSGTITTPTITGGGLTNWTLHSRVEAGASLNNLFLFRAYQATAITPAAILIDFAGQTEQNCAWICYETGGVVTTGTVAANSVVQTVAQDDGIVVDPDTMSITLAAFAKANNPTLGVIAVMLNSNTLITSGESFNQLDQVLSDDPTASCDLRIQVQSKAANDTVVDWTFNNSTSVRVMGIALELNLGIVTAGGPSGGGKGGGKGGGGGAGGGGGPGGGGGKPPKGGGGGTPANGILVVGRRRWRTGVI